MDEFQIPGWMKLADPEFSQPTSIDMLIGGEIFFKIIGDSKYKLGPKLPYIINSAFGWIISGKESNDINPTATVNTFLISTDPLQETLTKFWSIEHSYNGKPVLSSEERTCENVYEATTQRNQDCRYIVRLPLRENAENLGNSFQEASRWFDQLERRFVRKPEIRHQYQKFMDEYLKLDHMQLATPNQASPTYYLPHHAVFKDSDISKIRIVFDGSMKTNTGKSLNDIMLLGPIVQQDLMSIVIRFRTHKIAFSTDISKMYRQILVHEDDINLQRILWRTHPTEEIKQYQLKTVTYGTAAAPYLATKTIQRLTEDEKNTFPNAALRVSRDTYVDDIMTGADTKEGALSLQDEIINLLNSAGFTLHKWCSNSSELLSHANQCQQITEQREVKTLGLIWSPINDRFKFTVKTRDKISTTKREILSDIAMIFDPLGLLRPIILKAKIFMQELWRQQVGWDEILNIETINAWKDWKSQLPHLQNLEIPCCVNTLTASPISYEIHGFSDASQTAYGAVVYIKSTDANQSSTVDQVASKSRVAPLKTTTLPRLELNGALLLAKLVHKLKTSLELNITSVTLWTDSSIVLAWLREDPNRWTTYVANRVSEIQELTTDYNWRHIRSKDNPADILSRGSDIYQLESSELWWHGPDFLDKQPSDWPVTPKNIQTSIPEVRSNKILQQTLLITHTCVRLGI